MLAEGDGEENSGKGQSKLGAAVDMCIAWLSKVSSGLERGRAESVLETILRICHAVMCSLVINGIGK